MTSVAADTARSYARVAMFGMGFGELLVVLVIVLLVFGPGRLPENDGESREGVAGVQEGAARAARGREGARERRPGFEAQARSLTGAVSRGDAFTRPHGGTGIGGAAPTKSLDLAQ